MRTGGTQVDRPRDDQSPEPPRRPRKGFRRVLGDLQKRSGTAEPQFCLQLSERGPTPVFRLEEIVAGAAPARGLERVDAARGASPSVPTTVSVRATVATQGRQTVDLHVQSTGDGVRIAILASTLHSERLTAGAGTLVRRLTSRDIRVRALRVSATPIGRGSEDSRPTR